MAEMRRRAIFGVLLAVTAIFAANAALAQAAPQFEVVMTHTKDPFEGDKFIRGPEAAGGNRWDLGLIPNIGDETTSGPITFTDVLPPGVKVVGIGYGTWSQEQPFTCPSITEVNAGVPLTCTMYPQSPPKFDGGPEHISPGAVYGGPSFTVEVLPGSPD